MMIVLSGKSYGMSATDMPFVTVVTQSWKIYRSQKLWNH